MKSPGRDDARMIAFHIVSSAKAQEIPECSLSELVERGTVGRQHVPYAIDHDRITVGDHTFSVTELLGWVGLGDKMEKRPPTLSGGEQQRIAIARAVINCPKLLVADEPTGNIDHEIGTRILYLFEELNRHGTTVLIATHDAEIVNHFDHPQLHLENGTLSLIPAKKAKAA